MKITLTLGLLLLISCTWLQGQMYGQSDAKQNSDSASADKIQGCLQSSQGHYTLTDKTGNTQELWGAANKLGHLVGHEVELTGTVAIKTTDATMQGIASSAHEQHVYRVKTVKDLSKTCTQ